MVKSPNVKPSTANSRRDIIIIMIDALLSTRNLVDAIYMIDATFLGYRKMGVCVWREGGSISCVRDTHREDRSRRSLYSRPVKNDRLCRCWPQLRTITRHVSVNTGLSNWAFTVTNQHSREDQVVMVLTEDWTFKTQAP